jgi:FKBP-type peptidyl-prolyl cis-trans isomerase
MRIKGRILSSFLLGFCLSLFSCGEEEEKGPNIHLFPDLFVGFWEDVTITNPMGETVPSGVRYLIKYKGEGAPLKSGDLVRVQYTGWYEDGEKYASSLDRSSPFRFHFGKGEVIKGWDMTMDKVNRGGKFYVVVPPQYGDDKDQKKTGKTVVFGIHLLKD